MDILPTRNPEEELKYHRELQSLITELSTRFIEQNINKLDEAINYALGKVGSFVDVDRSYLFNFSRNGKTTSNTHEWCADNIHSQIQKLQNVPVDSNKWWMKRITKLNEVCVPDISSLPPEAECFKEVLSAQSIKSLVILPINVEGQLIGFLGFDSVRRERNWRVEEIKLLRILGELFAHVLYRKLILDELADMQEKLETEKKMSLIGQLASGIAHQLRNPLSVINNSVYFLQMKLDTDDEKINKHLLLMNAEIQRSADIISNLLHFVHVRKPQKEQKTLRTLISTAIQDIYIKDNIELNISYEENEPLIPIDIGLMKEVISNIVHNAIQSMPNGGTLSIETKSDGSCALIQIKDTGCGIPTEQIESIFEPLFTTKEASGGTGIGLTVCKSIVDAHNGSIEATSQPRQGSCFSIQLPVTVG